MSDNPSAQSPLDEPVPVNGSDEHHKGKKHKAKVRAAWISFVGRIIAQIAGAAATIVIGLSVLNHYAGRDTRAASGGDLPDSAPSQARRADHWPGAIDLAVLPLENLSADSTYESFADGMSDALMAHVARIEGLHVISRTSSMHYKGLRPSVPAVVADLGVAFIVEGTVASDNGRLRVTVRLVDARADHELWSRTYERPHRDILTLQTELAAAIAREVSATLAPLVEPRIAGAPRIETVMHDQYIRGRSAARLETAEGIEAAIRYFEQAIRLTPGFAPAYAGLAIAYAQLGVPAPSAPAAGHAFERAREAAITAIDLDPNLADAQTALAAVAHRLDRDWVASDQAYRRALALGPGNALAHRWYAVFLAEQGRHREALAEAERSLDLDPLPAETHHALGLVHYYAGRFDKAAAAARRAIAITPGLQSARLLLARSLTPVNGR
jgi:TolB-like protein/Tfp pilus assembly protein PilF